MQASIVLMVTFPTARRRCTARGCNKSTANQLLSAWELTGVATGGLGIVFNTVQWKSIQLFFLQYLQKLFPIINIIIITIIDRKMSRWFRPHRSRMYTAHLVNYPPNWLYSIVIPHISTHFWVCSSNRDCFKYIIHKFMSIQISSKHLNDKTFLEYSFSWYTYTVYQRVAPVIYSLFITYAELQKNCKRIKFCVASKNSTTPFQLIIIIKVYKTLCCEKYGSNIIMLIGFFCLVPDDDSD